MRFVSVDDVTGPGGSVVSDLLCHVSPRIALRLWWPWGRVTVMNLLVVRTRNSGQTS